MIMNLGKTLAGIFLFFIWLFSFESLLPEVSGNKYDLFMIGSVRGIGGQSLLGEGDRRQSAMFSANIVGFSSSGNFACNGNGLTTSGHTISSSGGSSQVPVQLGVLEERGFWNGAGIFYGFADLKFVDSYPYPLDYGQFTNSNVESNPNVTYLHPILYFAPQGFKISPLPQAMLYTSGARPEALGAGNSVNTSLIASSDWTNAKYGNFYRAFLKSAFGDITDNDVFRLMEGYVGSGSAQAPDPTGFNHGSSFPALTQDRLKQYYIPGNSTFLLPGIKDGNVSQIFLNPKVSKLGARINLSCNPFDGVTINARLGVASISVTPVERKALVDHLSGGSSGSSSSSALDVISDMGRFELALNDLGLTLKNYSLQSLEDLYVNFVAGQPIDLTDRDGDLQGQLFPFISGGVWAPTSKSYEKAEGSKFALYIPIGNEGHFGYSGSFGVSLNWKGMFCATCGGGATIFNEISIKDFRMPNHVYQRGLYPFTIDVKRKKGKTFFGYASLKSISFEDGVSVYADLVYTTHAQDEITLNSSYSEKNNIFASAKSHFEDQTSWSSTDFILGFDFSYFENFRFAGGVVTNFNGVFVPRMKTLFGDLTFIF